ncbi:hypothetical protein PVAND_011045 [Polypedilum vanderplanki]|uniref:CRAL/TRIO N-terminal domain-containing protein n=1 Tax=Polypedilum vanderplanki TaxID=319348 RepID=A0A9J6CI55_POLVA|nr:hypothetical protein PVAND_011045 [Polypedilum vanderplanki]
MDSKVCYTKSITPIDDYICTLPLDTQKLAEEELRETETTRTQAIEALREWAQQNPRIKSLRLDANFLLRFLRCKKFSIPMAKEMIERYLVLRHYTYDNMKPFQNFDMNMPVMQELLDAGYIFACPKRDHLNRRIIMIRPGVFNPSKHFNYEMVKLHGIAFETLMEDEMNHIHGFVYIIDSTGLAFHYLTLFTPHEAYRIGRNLEKVVPMRHKSIHGLKVHPSLKFTVDFALSQMSEKMRKRVTLYKNIEDITVDKNLLPAEYGGQIPMKEMISAFKKELESKRSIILKNDNSDVFLEMYPEPVRNGSVRSLKTTIDDLEAQLNKNNNNGFSKIELQGVQGSFRKLEID